MAFHCPRCARVSWSERDLAEGYCARCRDWTGADDLTLVCGACGSVRPSASVVRTAVVSCDRGHAAAFMRLRWAVPDALEPQGLFQFVPPDPLTLQEIADTLGQQTLEERQAATRAYLLARYAGVPSAEALAGVIVDEAARFAAGLGLDVPPVSRHQVGSAPTARKREWFEATGLLVNRFDAERLGSPEGNNPVNTIPYQNQGNPPSSSWETDRWDEEDWSDAAVWHPGYEEL